MEIDRDRFELLRGNVKQCSTTSVVRFFNDDFLRVLQREGGAMRAKRPLVFLDPPWGGVDYKKQVGQDDRGSGTGVEDEVSEILVRAKVMISSRPLFLDEAVAVGLACDGLASFCFVLYIPGQSPTRRLFVEESEWSLLPRACRERARPLRSPRASVTHASAEECGRLVRVGLVSSGRSRRHGIAENKVVPKSRRGGRMCMY